MVVGCIFYGACLEDCKWHCAWIAFELPAHQPVVPSPCQSHYQLFGTAWMTVDAAYYVICEHPVKPCCALHQQSSIHSQATESMSVLKSDA